MKKKALSLLLAVALCLGLSVPAFAAGNMAYSRDLKVWVTGYESNGVTPWIPLDARALVDANGNETNYVGIRDLAAWLTLCGAAERYDVVWENNAINIKTHTNYSGSSDSWTGADAEPYTSGVPAIYVDGVRKDLQGITITDSNGGGHTFYQLRALGEAVGFGVDWSQSMGVYLKCTSVVAGLSNNVNYGTYVGGGDLGGLGDVMNTYWFNFVVDNAYFCSELGEYVPNPGYQFLAVHLTMKNTLSSGSSVPMFDTDFMLMWDDPGSEEDYAFPVRTQLVSGQLPEEYSIPGYGTKDGWLFFTVPTYLSDGTANVSFTLCFEEVFEDTSVQGDYYFVDFVPYLY